MSPQAAMTRLVKQGFRLRPEVALRRGRAWVLGAAAATTLSVAGFGALTAGPALADMHQSTPPQGTAPLHPTTLMTREMHALRVDVQRMHEQMERIERTADPAQRRQLMQDHLASMKQTLSKLHAMELRMVDDVNKGRVVSDADLANRQRLLAAQTAMLLEMLEQAIRATGSASMRSVDQ